MKSLNVEISERMGELILKDVVNAVPHWMFIGYVDRFVLRVIDIYEEGRDITKLRFWKQGIR